MAADTNITAQIKPDKCCPNSGRKKKQYIIMDSIIITIIFNYALQPFKVYHAIRVRRSNFRHQASPRVTTREYPAAEGGTVGEKCPVILPKCRITRYI